MATAELFQSTRPLGFAAGDANLYRYAGNSPTNATDPSGLITYDGDPGKNGPYHQLKVANAAGRAMRRLDIALDALKHVCGLQQVYGQGGLHGPKLLDDGFRQQFQRRVEAARSEAIRAKFYLNGTNRGSAEAEAYVRTPFGVPIWPIYINPRFYTGSNERQRDVIVHELGRIVGYTGDGTDGEWDVAVWDFLIDSLNSNYDQIVAKNDDCC